MSKCWKSGKSAHIGLDKSYTSERGVCLNAPDQSNYNLEANEKIWGVFIYEYEEKYPAKEVVIVIDGVIRHAGLVNGEHKFFWWNYLWFAKPEHHLITFRLRDAETKKTLLSTTTNINQVEDDGEDEDETPPPPDAGELELSIWKMVDDAKDKVVDRVDLISSQIDSLVSSVSDFKNGVIDKVDESISSTVDGFKNLSDEIKKLSIPTVDDIKECFLSVVVELADGLWDRILDKIEERYKK